MERLANPGFSRVFLKHLFIMVMVVLTLSLGFIDTKNGLAGRGPIIQFDEETYDFGQVSQGEIPEHIFTFKNVGDEELVIKKITTS